MSYNPNYNPNQQGYVPSPNYAYNTGVYPTTQTTYSVGHPGGYTNGQAHQWNNPYGLNVPLIAFTPNCRKCNGSGTCRSRFSGTPMPCTRCYTRNGYCKRCYGTGTNYRKGKACNKCQTGKRMNNKSSSSSDSN